MVQKIRSRSIALLLGLFVALSSVLAFAPNPAAAAPDVTYPDAIKNIRLSYADKDKEGTAQQWDRFRIDADWQVPDSAQAGETFGMTLPPELAGIAESFELRNPQGQVVGTCTAAPGDRVELICTLSEFVNTHEQVSGTLWLEVEARTATDETTLEFILDGKPYEVDIPGEGGIIGNDKAPENLRKGVSGYSDQGELNWHIQVPATYAQNGVMTVSDRLLQKDDDESLENHTYVGLGEGGYFAVYRQQIDADGNFLPDGDWEAVDAADYTSTFPTGPGETSFKVDIRNVPTTPGYIYGINYKTKPAGEYLIDGSKYGNEAGVSSTIERYVHTYHPRGGGDGNGTQFTRFGIQKSISGQGAGQVPADTVFTVEYTVDGETLPLEFSIGEEGRAESERFPVGSTFTIREVELPDVPGVTWGDYTLTGEGVVDNGDGSYSITPSSNATVELLLTNEANPSEQPTPSPTPSESDQPTPSPTPSESDQPTPGPTPSESDQPVPSPTSSESPRPDRDRDDEGSLPRTGTTLLPLAVGAVLLGLGATALGAARRRQQ